MKGYILRIHVRVGRHTFCLNVNSASAKLYNCDCEKYINDTKLSTSLNDNQ